MDQVHIMFWGIGIVVLVTLVVGIIKESGSWGPEMLIVLPAIVILAVILYFGFFH